MRLLLAETFGGGPAYWGLPPFADEATVTTAISILTERAEKHGRR